MPENTLKVDKSTVHVAEVVRFGDKVILPTGMDYRAAIDLLLRRMDYDEKTVGVNRIYDAFWTEGAIALDKVLTERFGWSPHTHTLQQTMFGKKVIPPQQIDVETSYGQHKSVPWGSFLIPGTEAVLNMESVNTAKLSNEFAITGEVKRKWQPQVDELLAAVAAELTANSLYKGKAWSIDFSLDSLPHWDMVVQIADKHHLKVTITPYGDLIGSRSELARLRELYKLEERLVEYGNERKNKG